MIEALRPWGTTISGEQVFCCSMRNEAGFQAEVSTYGAALTALHVPFGERRSVVLGFDSLDEYMADEHYFGRMIGRVANRIGSARFELDGQGYALDRNQGRHHLHGGREGFHARVWSIRSRDEHSVELVLHSPDGDGGYPGALDVSVSYVLIDDGLRIDCRARADRATPVSMTNHSYFDLNGGDGQGHALSVRSHKILVMDDELVPTGKFRTTDDGVIRLPGMRDCRDGNNTLHRGIDEYHVFESGHGAQPVAVVRGAHGLAMEVHTTQPGMQVYSGEYIPEELPGRDGSTFGPCAGFCLETHGYPDAVNHAGFPDVIMRPGEVYEHTTEYRFRFDAGWCETNTGE